MALLGRGAFHIVTVLFILVTVVSECEGSGNGTCTRVAEDCRKGIILPLWTPTGNLSPGDKAARATVYFVAMIYMFLGVSIVSDRFMAAIEVITSREKEVVIKKPSGETQTVNVRIWNETVSNLTLMALGSSAPEILLSCIEVIGNKFEAGDLGPSTIVGSAAFNLFIITAICVSCLPGEEIRRVKHLRVFFITATWSVFAYLWMYFILSVSSYAIVEVWEALLTLVFFPLTVLTAYVADKKIFVYNFLSKRYSNKQRGVVIGSEGDTEMGKANHAGGEVVFKGLDSEDKDVREFEIHRREFMEILKDLRKKNPNADMKTLEEMSELEAINRGPKSRAFYRIQATRKLTGSGNVIKKSKIERRASLDEVKVDFEDDSVTRVFFDPGHYTVMENVGSFDLTVTREGGDLKKTIYVDYKTEDGTANAGSDYEHAEGTLIFYPMEVHKQFPITVLDDDIFEEDEHLYVRLSNLRVGDTDGMFESNVSASVAKLSTPFLATVMILDDDHPGIFHFEEAESKISEAIGEAQVKVIRSSGARGTVKLPYYTSDGTAKAGKDYEHIEGELTFINDETEKYIKVRIYDDEEYEKNEVFNIHLGEPYLTRRGSETSQENGDPPSSDDESGKPVDTDSGAITNGVDDELSEQAKPQLGEIILTAIHIKESQEFKSVVDKLLKKANVSLVVGTSSWREQFCEAITVSPGDEDEEETEEKLPSCMDYIMHFLTLFWKVMFAIVPPTDYWGGWACFCISIFFIGLLTAFIGDLASGFGCTIGLKDSITAISFVALGTSVPDTFASKVAATNDKYADSSIGNVTGSNAVNVFLGIGIAWSIAAIYHAANNTVFQVEPGTLAFSVTVFCIEAVICIAVLIFRRKQFIGGELGGPRKYRIPTSIFFSFLWITYIVISAMVAYCYIPGF